MSCSKDHPPFNRRPGLHTFRYEDKGFDKIGRIVLKTIAKGIIICSL